MDFRSLRLVFMGTPDFAVASLEALHKAGCNIVGVVTSPDKPAGRGLQLSQSAVKQYAVANDLPVLQPTNLKAQAFVDELKALKPDLQIVVAFRMLPEIVWALPPMGTFNLHGSLLPQYRGAAPINWAVINGEKETGVTTFLLKHEIDTGNVLFQERFAITQTATAGEVYNELMHIGAHLVLKTVQALFANEVTPVSQADLAKQYTELKAAPKIFKEDCVLDWNQNTLVIYNKIRGLSPYPTAFTSVPTDKNEKLTLKIFKAECEFKTPADKPGTVWSDGKTFLKVATNDGYIDLQDVQLAGKKRMLIQDFLRGFGLKSGLMLE